MNEPEWLARDMILFECNMAQEAVELRYFPNKAAFLVVFLTSAITLDATRAAIYGIVTWIVLSLVMRPRLVSALCGTHIAVFVSLLGAPLRWLIAISCSAYIWFATQNSSWDGWPVLAIVFLLDLFAVLFIENKQSAPFQREKELLQNLPSVFRWEDVKQFSTQLPITSRHRPFSIEEKLAFLHRSAPPCSRNEPNWLHVFTHVPIDKAWSVYTKGQFEKLPNDPCVFLVFNSTHVQNVGNSEWQGMVGEWRKVLAAITESNPWEVRIAWLSTDDDLNAACWWLEQRLSPTIILYRREAVPEAQQFIEETIKQLNRSH